MSQTPRPMPLGIEGFSFADLHVPARLRDLYEEFCQHTATLDPALWERWDAYRTAPDAPRPVTEVSDLIVEMAPHVSRFVGRLFKVGAATGDLKAHTHQLDALFRFKVDFVRKRALPLVKGGAHVPRDPADVAIVEKLAQPFSHLDRERAVAAAGCALLDGEASLRDAGSDAE
jgi:hypothetical protein